MTNLHVCEAVDEVADHGAEEDDGQGLDDAVDGGEEQRVRPDADHVQPHRELPHTETQTRKTWPPVSSREPAR